MESEPSFDHRGLLCSLRASGPSHLYCLLEVARAQGRLPWRIALERLAEQLHPSHLQRVLQPAHEMLLSAGLVPDAAIRQYERSWFVDYLLATWPSDSSD